MNLLGAILYDPAVAVTKATTAALAMTALDTTNLRLAVTVPSHGIVTFKMRCAIHGAATYPQILLGVLNGSTVVGRVAPMAAVRGTALAQTVMCCEAEFTVSGLTPGATNFDAAYGVEVLIASTGIKYGGPNNAVANDAFGAFVFEAWDPRGDTTGTTTLLTRVPSALTITAGAVTVGTLATDVITADVVSAAAVTKIQAGLPAAILDFADGVETGVTPKGALRALLATLAGTATGGGTSSITFSNPAGAASRVVMTVDADGNRSSVTLSV